MNLKAMAVVASGVVASIASGDAVQWRVADGGNGHWYQRIERNGRNWSPMRSDAESRGGHLATVTSQAESDFLVQQILGGRFCFIGGFQPGAASEPSEGWQWLTGEPIKWTNWAAGEPNNYAPAVDEDVMATYGDGRWIDVNEAADLTPTDSAAYEWSADCNNDGIVDFGQCRDGSLADFNGNNVPDCCEQGAACDVGRYPFEWRTSDGGNGHWYQSVDEFVSFPTAQAAAVARGGHLATLVTEPENSFIASRGLPYLRDGELYGYWIGGVRSSTSGSWAWITGEPWGFSSFAVSEPNGCCGPDVRFLVLRTFPGHEGRWDDTSTNGNQDAGPMPFLVEFDTDCNGDGAVDYGQILRGELSDADGDGIPAVCEPCLADIVRDAFVNGIDLAAVLNNWGTDGGVVGADVNHDGLVDGSDLALVLGSWGPCGG
ncbi:MAG: hypothetical protein RL325_1372 [Planctomycetota bacterium]